MSIITSVIPNTKHINNSGTGFYFHDTIEPHRRKLFSAKENQVILELMSKHKAFIGGGFAVHAFAMLTQGLKLPYGDVDFYFPTEEHFKDALNYVKFVTGYSDQQLETKPYMGETVRAATFDMEGRTYQLIRATFGTVQETFDTFDFGNSKAAIVYNPTSSSSLEFMVDEKLPVILQKQIVQYRIQQHLTFDTLKEKQKHAQGNISRLEKYIERFPKGFWDEESKTQLLQQYAWNFKYHPTEPYNVTQLCQILSLATQDQLILFFPLGGEWKKAFESQGLSLKPYINPGMEKHVMFPNDTVVSLGNPESEPNWGLSHLAELLKGKLSL